MSEPMDAASLAAQLRTYGRTVDAARRPVDVDAILRGAVAVPRRRLDRRASLALVAAAVAVILGVTAVVTRDDSEPVRVVGPPAPSVGSSLPGGGEVLVRRSTTYGGTLEVRRVPAVAAGRPCVGTLPDRCAFGPWIEADFSFSDSTIEVSTRGELDDDPPDAPLRAVSSSSSLRGGNVVASITVWQVRADVHRVVSERALANGQTLTDDMAPVDGVVALVDVDRSDERILSAATKAYDAEGNLLGEGRFETHVPNTRPSG